MPAPLAPADWVAHARTFAAEHIASRPDLHEQDTFPHDLWREMAAAGLTALGIPAEHGGHPIATPNLMATMEALVRTGRNLGCGSTLLAHIGHADFVIRRLGSPAQQAHYLPLMARGEETLCVAISEPGAGAHPKHLTTRAEPDGDGWRLYGEKTYLTNGPIATVFAVLAITAVEDGVKRYSILLVPRDADGTQILPGGNVDFLKPAGHCSLRLDGVRVGADALVGPLGEGYPILAKPMRDHEDLVGLGNRFGALAAELDAIKAAAGDRLAGEAAERFGELAALLAGQRALATAALTAGAGTPAAELLLLDIRNRNRAFQAGIAAIVEALALELPPRDAALRRDLDKLGSLAGYVQRLRQERLAAAW